MKKIIKKIMSIDLAVIYALCGAMTGVAILDILHDDWYSAFDTMLFVILGALCATAIKRCRMYAAVCRVQENIIQKQVDFIGTLLKKLEDAGISCDENSNTGTGPLSENSNTGTGPLSE